MADYNSAYTGAQIDEAVEKAQASLRFSGTEVATEDFAADTTYEDYPYRAAVALTGVTAAHDADVRFDAPDAASGVFAPAVQTYDGGVYLYAAEVPEAAVTIPRIICDK